MSCSMWSVPTRTIFCMIDSLTTRLLCKIHPCKTPAVLNHINCCRSSLRSWCLRAVAAPVQKTVTGRRFQNWPRRPVKDQQGIAVRLHPATTAVRKPKVVILTGPTAVGKTDTSLALAEALDGEIISADSVQVYKGLDIGSDKIPEAERRGIPHHLIDILDPDEEFSAGHFYHLARNATEQILQRGKVPIVVGGTGFYLRFFVHGKPQTPTATPEGAAKVSQFLQQTKDMAVEKQGGELTDSELWTAHCQAIEDLGDLEAANRLRTEVNNQYRLRRVLEIILTTGKPLAAQNLDIRAPLDYDFRCFFLNRPRIQLYDRIGLRCEQMVQKGLLKEAKQLLGRNLKANSNNCATKAIGYRQALTFLERCQAADAPPSRASMVQMVKDIQAKSRNLCHHQLAWFRDEPLFHWVDASQPFQELIAELVGRISLEEHEGNTGGCGGLTKEEARELRGYIYQQQLICQPEVQAAVLSELA